MRYLLLALLAVALALSAIGCSENAQRTEATQVENPQIEAKTQEGDKPEEPAGAVKTRSGNIKPSEGFTLSDSGLQYKDVKVGSGKPAETGDEVSVLYKGWLDNGKVFDSSALHNNEPFTFTVGVGVISGWSEGVRGMKVGGKRELIIPPDLGYGSDDNGPIPANSTLHFTIEVLHITKQS